jgi:hypothetical protein
MNAVARQTLMELVATYGHGLCHDPRRCEGLLRDFCGQYRREIFVLVHAAKAGIAAELLAPPGPTPAPAVIGRLARRLEEDLAFAPDAARWAVESWALALGVLAQPLPAPAPDAGAGAGAAEASVPAQNGGGAAQAIGWTLGVATLWAAIGASAGTLAAGLLGAPDRQPAWTLTGLLGGALLGAIASLVARVIGGAIGEVIGWAVSGTVGGAALGAVTGAAAGGLVAAAFGGPGAVPAQALRWAVAGATAGGLLATVLGAVHFAALTPRPPAPASFPFHSGPASQGLLPRGESAQS